MKETYLEVTFRRGRPFAAYLYLPRKTGDKSFRTSKAKPGIVVDYDKSGRAIGIEITAPTKVSVSDLNHVLRDIGAQPVTENELSPLQAA